MTVSELIAALAAQPRDFPVIFTDDRQQIYTVKDVATGTAKEAKTGRLIPCLLLWSNQSTAKEADLPPVTEEVQK